VGCEDCHNPHGSAETAMLSRPMISGELCVQCHTGKRGPFVYEHLAGTVEGCIVCHESHGSANRFMLKTNRTSELCIMCHVEAPTVHNLADQRYQNCTTCHTAIHGSDSHYLFFRR
jgi:DmsE family decaheme c-type cytochrome